ncbi:hypothetical protein SAMN05444166_3099 [Singulisphaera sp. GP187]|nr:hypothetical protein SAMN05444166_3099 [Singulisphaera sp. GP187]
MIPSDASRGVSLVSSLGKLWWDGFSLVFTTMCAATGVALPFRILYHLELRLGGVTPWLGGMNVALLVLGGPLIFRTVFRALNYKRPRNERL